MYAASVAMDLLAVSCLDGLKPGGEDGLLAVGKQWTFYAAELFRGGS